MVCLALCLSLLIFCFFRYSGCGKPKTAAWNPYIASNSDWISLLYGEDWFKAWMSSQASVNFSLPIALFILLIPFSARRFHAGLYAEDVSIAIPFGFKKSCISLAISCDPSSHFIFSVDIKPVPMHDFNMSIHLPAVPVSESPDFAAQTYPVNLSVIARICPLSIAGMDSELLLQEFYPAFCSSPVIGCKYRSR